MDLTDVRSRLAKKNKILFRQDSPSFQELMARFEATTQCYLILWAFELAEEIITELEKRYPDDARPRRGLDLARQWARGEIKMPLAKRAILDVHQMAKEIRSPVDIALVHAIGQGLSTVHLKEHAIGLPMYQLSALVFEHGIDDVEPLIEKQLSHYLDVLDQIEQLDVSDYPWAIFLQSK